MWAFISARAWGGTAAELACGLLHVGAEGGVAGYIQGLACTLMFLQMLLLKFAVHGL